MIKLRELLEEQGINLADVDVSDHSSEEFSEDNEEAASNSEIDGEQEDGVAESQASHSVYVVDHYA